MEQTLSLNSAYLLALIQSLASLVAQTAKRLPTKPETRVRSLGQEDPLEEETATHSGILAWEISWTKSLVGSSPWGHRSWTGLSHFTI